MEFLNKILSSDPDFKSLLKDVCARRVPLACTGLSDIHKAVVIKSIFAQTNTKCAVITSDEASALKFTGDLNSLGLKALNFPLRDYCLQNLTGHSKEYEHKRTDTLSALADGAFDVVCFSVDSALQYTVPPEVLTASRFTLSQGEEIDTKLLTEKLLDAGYVRSEQCEGKGQFAVRGGIFDIFPITAENPVRIEFWGDEIDTLSFFDIETQRRTEPGDPGKGHFPDGARNQQRSAENRLR